eukprot:15835-Heterococcus_DN1.PRE.3
MYSPSSSGDLGTLHCRFSCNGHLLFAIYQDTATLICLLVPEGHSNGQCSPESNQDVNTSKEAAPLARASKLILAISDTCTLSVMASQSLCSLSSSGSLSRPSHEGGKLTIRFCMIDIPFLCIGGELRNTQQDVQVQAAQDLRRFDCTVDVPITRKII